MTMFLQGMYAVSGGDDARCINPTGTDGARSHFRCSVVLVATFDRRPYHAITVNIRCAFDRLLGDAQGRCPHRPCADMTPIPPPGTRLPPRTDEVHLTSGCFSVCRPGSDAGKAGPGSLRLARRLAEQAEVRAPDDQAHARM